MLPPKYIVQVYGFGVFHRIGLYYGFGLGNGDGSCRCVECFCYVWHRLFFTVLCHAKLGFTIPPLLGNACTAAARVSSGAGMSGAAIGLAVDDYCVCR
jgi:hypothetical protein